MSYLTFKSAYDRFPKTIMEGYEAICGYDKIKDELEKRCHENTIIVFDYYPGVDEEEIMMLIQALHPDHVVNMKDIFKDGKTMTEQMRYHLTDDRTFGKMYFGELLDFMDESKLTKAQEAVKSYTGFTLIYGVGASLVTKGDLLVYFDLTRWEITLRYRAGMPNYNADNFDEDNLKKIKRGYFIEWRIADKHKMKYFDAFDYVIDINKRNDPKMITGDAFRDSLKQLALRPFRLVPYFDPGVWGGQWMKEACNLDSSQSNYAWSFDGVPEENSILFDYQGVEFELPAMDLVLYQPLNLLGKKVYARFGAEFPIRFDFLDTMNGQNLSLQVHPLTEYIHREFGMSYTQDESYYILDAGEGAHVYLGLKEGIDKDAMISDLKKAQAGEIVFDAEKYVNNVPAKKHDHFLIPAGTIHCSGSESMVLEISATPYIFTFKLWDWGRLGLDGLPRPINIEHGQKVIQWDRTTDWVQKNLVNAVVDIENEECKEEHTGLHELEFIETRRYTFDRLTHHDTQGTVNMLNLVEGKEAIIESPTNAFAPYVVHYAETFIVPASVGAYTIRPYGRSVGETIMVLKAYVRNTFDE